MDALHESLYQAALPQLARDQQINAATNLDASLFDVGLPKRAETAFQWEGLRTVGDVACCPDHELLRKVKNLGPRTLAEVRKIIPYREQERRQYRDADARHQ
jgi:hypothetical protein